MGAARKSERTALDGLLLIDKPSGMTSHDAVQKVRRIFGQREVGHAGTLDPMATGLLVMALGKATRLLRFVESNDKRYTGTVRLGAATTTYDREGEITREAPVPELLETEIERALATLEGEIAQQVPQYSAVKVQGERLYTKARRGEVFEAPIRKVHVFTLMLRRLALPDLEIEALVSKGTYIRTLAVQIGEALGVPAHLVALRRVAIGAHRVEEAKTLDGLSGDPSELVPMDRAVDHLAELSVGEEVAAGVRHGRAIDPPENGIPVGEARRVIGPRGELLAIVQGGEGGRVEYACVLAAEVR
jgi:tRNA pseudouridine55 synthase